MNNVMNNIKASAFEAGRWASYGMLAGYAAAYLASAMKIARALNPMTWAIGIAAGLATQSLVTFYINKINATAKNYYVWEFIHRVAIPVVSALAGILASTYATPLVFTACVVAAAAFFLGSSLSSLRPVHYQVIPIVPPATR